MLAAFTGPSAPASDRSLVDRRHLPGVERHRQTPDHGMVGKGRLLLDKRCGKSYFGTRDA